MTNPLTFDDVANIYDKYHKGASRPARTLPMDKVLDWIERRKDLVTIDKDGYFYLKQEKKREENG